MKWYDRCFNSLRLSNTSIKVIVVDNASVDGTVDYIKANYPEVNLIESKVNLGFGEGNNVGIRHALKNDADFVFLLNQDTWIKPDTISELVRIQRQNPQYGILSPININASEDNILKGFLNLLVDYRNVEINWLNDLYFKRLNDIYKIESINAASWLLSRKILDEVGGFDPMFFYAGEDDNYLQRAKYHGFLTGICPKLTIVHDTHKSVEFADYLNNGLYKRVILMNCGNINEDRMPDRFVVKSLKDLFVSLIKLKYARCSTLFKELRYYGKNRKQILYSRQKNIHKGQTWLFD